MYETKYVLAGALVLNCASMFMFTQTTDFTLLLASRFLTGVCQVFVSIFFPVWADTFGSSDSEKSAWLNVLMLAAVIGVVLGYILTTWCIAVLQWQYVYYIQLAFYVLALIPFLLTPSKYIDVDEEINR